MLLWDSKCSCSGSNLVSSGKAAINRLYTTLSSAEPRCHPVDKYKYGDPTASRNRPSTHRSLPKMDILPNIPTAPNTPVKGLGASPATLGSGDRDFSFPAQHAAWKTRPLRLASPPPQPLWTYASPPRTYDMGNSLHPTHWKVESSTNPLDEFAPDRPLSEALDEVEDDMAQGTGPPTPCQLGWLIAAA